MSFELSIYAGRTHDFAVSITDVGGNLVTIGPSDVLRFKLGRHDSAAPQLDLNSSNATPAGSSITAANPATLRIAQDDSANLTTGVYTAEVGIVDDSETAPADALKHASAGVVHVLPTLGGEVDKP